MDIPMGVPDLDDQYSNGLAGYIGVPSLPGVNNAMGPQARSGSGPAAQGNGISSLYNQFPMPQLQPNTAGMTKWYGPEFAPPGPPMMPPGPQQQSPPREPPRPNDGCKNGDFFFAVQQSID